MYHENGQFRDWVMCKSECGEEYFADLTLGGYSWYFAAGGFGQGMVVACYRDSLAHAYYCRRLCTPLIQGQYVIEATEGTIKNWANVLHEGAVNKDNSEHHVSIVEALQCGTHYFNDGSNLAEDKAPQLQHVRNMHKNNVEFYQKGSPDEAADF